MHSSIEPSDQCIIRDFIPGAAREWDLNLSAAQRYEVLLPAKEIKAI